MKLKMVGWLSAAAMLASSALVCVMVPDPRAKGSEPAESLTGEAVRAPARFSGGEALAVDVRLGRDALPRAGAREELLLVDVQAPPEVTATARVPSSTALVIDRSGSMAGPRIESAIAAARRWVTRMVDGDRLTVVAFEGSATVLLPLTVLTASSRPEVMGALGQLVAQGNTCLSCGIERAQHELIQAPGLKRMIVLSDGKATTGAKTVEEARAIAGAAREADISIVTLGFGQDYAEDLLATLAFDSNGSHHFVERASTLEEVFDREADKLTATAARDGQVTIELGDDVELVRVLDRAHDRQGSRIVVPLGAFTAGQQKTVLAEVRVRGDGAALRHVAAVRVTFRDPGDRMETVDGSLVVAMADRAGDLDPLVALRLARGRGAHGLEEAAALFEQGQREEALAILDDQLEELASLSTGAPEVAASAASVMATARESRARLEAAPLSSARTEVLRNKATANLQLE